MKVYPCPICGQSKNRHAEPMDTPQKTAGHIDGARDDQHDGESGKENMRAIRENESEVDPEEMEQPEQRPASRQPAGNALDEETVQVPLFDNEEMTVREYVKTISGYLDAAKVDRVQMGEDIEDMESDIEELREQVSDMEDALNRMLGYMQVLAQETDSGQITEDMLEEGFV